VSEELKALLPASKMQVEKAEALVRLGYPAVAPVLPEILEWMKDLNWPVARVFQPLLARIGEPLAPLIRDVLAGSDDIWKYWLVLTVVRESPSLAAELQPELLRLAESPSVGEQSEGASKVAQELLRLPAAKSDA
jgi:hypothetical protein